MTPSRKLVIDRTFSKKFTIILFIVLPILAFFIGTNYQKFLTNKDKLINQTPCTDEVKICSDGSSVGRTGTKCEFTPCPTINQENKQRIIKPPKVYECPKSDYVDCMPGPNKLNSECSAGYLQWAQENCPGFNGAAY